MSIDIRILDDEDEWDRYVDRSDGTNLFHRYAALEVQAQYTNAELYPLAGFKGQEAVGLFPVFEIRKGPVSAAFSPPPEIRVPYLGPALLNVDKLKRRKRDRREKRFVENCLDVVDEEIGPKYTHFRTDERFDDLRPFIWNDHDVTPTYTYMVDLDADEETLQARFSSDARSNIRDGEDADYVIEEEGYEAIEKILEQVRARYEAQDVSFHLPTALVGDLFDRLPDGYVRPYALYVDGDFVGGILALDDGERVYRWQGGVRTDADVDIAPNDLLDWRVMSDARERGRSHYDLVGADDPRINRYKAKFGPDVEAYHSVEKGTPVMNKMAQLYRQLR
ncbi:GNAT family N-acetyltransferase [Halostella sp. JP-L12]|uniref:lipid II:glycine glycyltransferase FemX n=1 Tax=Halostella TaxID=1843185 RepID=UPI000EF80ECF|nr:MULTISPECIES: GNAT family N-acetyltransferase [Halostella]NHN49809.1 GNAT family N-acetyltransferase [Halostella sp. JP-L12]